MSKIFDGISPSQHAGLWASQRSVLSRATPGFSSPPEYADSDSYGGFNPNSFFALERTPSSDACLHTILALSDLNGPYDGSPTMLRALSRQAVPTLEEPVCRSCSTVPAMRPAACSVECRRATPSCTSSSNRLPVSIRAGGVPGLRRARRGVG
jgi:hypothetical protein